MIQSDTIVAISTPPGEGGIGIVRLSGCDAVAIVQEIFRSKSGQLLSELPSHRICYGHIVQDGEIVDEVLVTVMRAPRTYTREDVVEINCHGGIVPLKGVLEIALAKGARLGEPGEFTKRAFLNGRIDLSQAEAVLDIINSKARMSCRVALSQLEGGIASKVEGLSKILRDLLVELEASIDFAADGLVPPSRDSIRDEILRLAIEIEKLESTGDIGVTLREGLKASIVGRPNVGKSSLFNAVIGRDRMIVTPVPGTTRDIVEEIVDIEGIPVKLADTAGIVGDTVDVVEREGVERSLQSFRQADLLIVVIDGSEPLTKYDIRILEDSKGRKSITVINKCDLPASVDCEQVERILGRNGVLTVSARGNMGIDRLTHAITNMVWQGEIDTGEQAIVTNIRHLEALRKAREALRRALEGLENAGEELLAFDLRESLDSLGRIVGKVTSEDILDRIFSEFCIGK